MKQKTILSHHDWLAQFQKKCGRPLRVLHIGNIANNAYINAKIMRKYGIEADVISPDYYHCMGCPEWEDANFEGSIGDPNFPDWYSIDLKGFKRPTWFLQGPTILILKYLKEKNSGNKIKAKLIKAFLDFYRWQLCSKKISSKLIHLIKPYFFILISKIRRYKTLLIYTLFNLCRTIVNFLKSFFHITKKIFRLIKSLHKMPFKDVMCSFSMFINVKIKPIFFQSSKKNTTENDRRDVNKKRKSIDQYGVVEKIENEVRYAKNDTHGSLAPILEQDVVSYHSCNLFWSEVLSYYDVVQGYATSAIYPLLAEYKHYTAYEHGTLREIPFQDNQQGRICAGVYKKASAVFVTNTDCLVAAKKLGITEEKIIPLPHAFDSEKAFNFVIDHSPKIKLKIEPVTFIAPARHHWTKKEASWSKGNDVIIHAAKHLDRNGLLFKIIFIEWGNEIDKSKELIQCLDLEHCFEWVQPMLKKNLWIEYLSCAAVIDQFFLPAMGGVSFEALALGRRLLTKLDISILKSFFGEAPPVYSVSSSEELAHAMTSVIADPFDKAGVGLKSLEWVKKYHSTEVILEKQLTEYQRFFSVNF